MKSKPYLLIGTIIGAVVGFLLIPITRESGSENAVYFIFGLIAVGIVIGLILDSTVKR